MADVQIVWAGFILGLFGSAHCAGMCGPIALALPGAGESKFVLIFGRLLYNIGRVFTYMSLGLMIGLVGVGFSLAGVQQFVSIGAGLLLLMFALLPNGYLSRWMHRSPAFFNKYIGRWFQVKMRQGTYGSLFILGLLNGLLPCGFVYIGLIGAAGMTTLAQSVVFMGLFGLGTIPVMLAMSLITGFVSQGFRNKMVKIFPYMTAIVAILLILRGLDLGIPFISPHLSAGSGLSGATCH